MKFSEILKKLKKAIISAFPKGMKTSWWLIKITVPVSFGVMLLDYYGILALIAKYTGPLFSHMGLPGVSAIVLVTSIFTNVYSVVAILSMLNLPLREGVILATMCLVSHNFIIETVVMQRTGSSTLRMILLRIAGSFAIGFMLNMMMPGSMSVGNVSLINTDNDFNTILWNWFQSMSFTILKILILVNLLLILQKVMEEFGWIQAINKPLSPFMKLFGLPQSTTFSWIVANLIGLAYGSAIMIEESEKGRMSREDADLLNHHVSLSHSQLEDPLLFLTLGYTIHWLIWPRLIIAIAAVWMRKAELKLRAVYQRKKMTA